MASHHSSIALRVLLLLLFSSTPAVTAATIISNRSSTVVLASNITTITLSALLAFKQAISHDPTNFLALWNTSMSPDYCRWNGVRCSSGTREVIALLLGSKQLNGTITPQLEGLPHLLNLNLSNNSFYGPVPAELGELSYLTHIDLSVNRLTGSFPSSLVNCTLLQLIDFGTNSLSSRFPPFIASFAHLVYLDLSNNPFARSALPPDIGHLGATLEFFQAQGCSLVGSIPPSLITNSTKLVWLAVGFNELTGPLPSDWTKLAASLEMLYLEANILTGSIPPSLGNCTHLIQLQLYNNSLTGEMPQSLGQLTRLVNLGVFNNSFNGSIPTSIVNCTELEYLLLDFNYELSGSIPAGIGQLKGLKSITVTYTQLNGWIPNSIGDCTQLKLLALRFTDIGGPLPVSIYNLTQLLALALSSARFFGRLTENVRNLSALTFLALDDNAFNGTIPSAVGELRDLQGLYLQHNSFEERIPQLWHLGGVSLLDLSHNLLTGEIPASVGQLKFLNHLYLQNNGLFGTIPDALGSLARLQNLNLSHNKLTGYIPASLSVSDSLDLSYNRFTGTIPQPMGSMLMVSTVRLAGNLLAGKIPDSLGECRELAFLDLSVNNLEGEIPSTFGQLVSLKYIDMSHNKLSGSLPSFLGDLHNLVSLNVSYNALQGMIPIAGIFKNSSAAAFLGNPKLCGYPLPTNCTSLLPKENMSTLIASICSVGGGVVMIWVFACFWWRRWSTRSAQNTAYFDRECRKTLRKAQLRAWTARELREATNGFDRANVIGKGGASVCFQGAVQGTRADLKAVAIKKLNKMSVGSSEEEEATQRMRRCFVQQELKILCQVRHRNVVKALGYCVDEGEVALVMELMGRGNLEEQLHNLTWEERLNIAADVANGLVYLHHECSQPIIHCDLKPTNILLDSDMVAKISDFGIAKLLANDFEGAPEQPVSISNFKGTFGYAAPECASGIQISTRADVYSFGMLLIELVTGMNPSSPQLEESATTLQTWAKRILTSTCENLSLLDIVVQEAIKRDATILQHFQELLELGIRCTTDNAKDRPNIKVVMDTLVNFVKPELASRYNHVDLDTLLNDNFNF
ncbi:hypothetical protein L7F22_055539 [Adiantum nelumboides]|nr:hypothetical protein [Adiantum nelumboides]